MTKTGHFTLNAKIKLNLLLVKKSDYVPFATAFYLMLCHNKIISSLDFSPDYDVDYFRQFTIVLNALDNRGQYNAFINAIL